MKPRDAGASGRGGGHERGGPRPRWALSVLGATLLGFLVSGPVGIEPLWFAWAGALLLTVPDLARGAVRPSGVIRNLRPGFLAFVFALGLLADLLSRAGLDDAIASALPSWDWVSAPCSRSLSPPRSSATC